MTTLLLGGTGRIGGLVLKSLLDSAVTVKALVRSKDRLPADYRQHERLEIIEGNFADFNVDDFKFHLQGVTSVISCLGHNMNFAGIVYEELFVLNSARTVVESIESLKPPKPIRFIHLSTVGIMHPDGRDVGSRSWGERLLLSSLYYLVRPMRDSQDTVEYLYSLPVSNYCEWVALRPGNFVEGARNEYILRDTSSIFDTDNYSTMENIAAGLVELSKNDALWSEWNNKMPIIVNKQN